MATLTCPHCDNAFEWTEGMGREQVQCPLCGKTLRLVRKKSESGTRTEAEAKSTTSWGTDGFGSDERRERYGEIKKGDVLGGFRIERIVGAGAMAVVYEATQLSLDRRVALKVLPVEFAQRESFVRQFDSETDLLASLNHPNIVSIIDRGREGDTYYFAMEYVEGATLGELLSAGELDEDFLLQIMEQCAKALVYAHSKDIIHRDLKPANIMLNDQGIVKIADFGVAGLLAEARAQKEGKRRVMGTRGYMPPEQEQHINRTDERSDIFALGAVIYRVLTGQVPDRLPPAPPSELSAEVDPRIDSLVLKCLEAAPDRRYGSAEELLEALEAYHREVTRAQEVCPNCKKENPVTQRTCLNCGADLSELFDVCPECGTENRIDVEICMGCGSSLKQLRHQISVRISKLEEQARSLASRHRYEEALAELKEVAEVKGKVFERARQKASRLIEEYTELREEYYHSRAEEARQLTEKGRLNEALEIVESIPEDFVEKEGVESLAINIKSRMALARKRLEGIEKMLEERRFEEAEQALAKAAQTWVDCPGLAEARRKVESSRQTEEMVHYELAEAKEQMEQGNYAKAREVLQFALSTSPDQPDVKRLLEEIDRRERRVLLKRALGEGKAAYEEGDFRKAMQCWKNALGTLPEDDPRREKLLERVRAARQKALGTQIVPLEPSPVVPLQAAGSGGGGLFGRSGLSGLLVFVGTAIALIGGFLVFLALSG